MEFIDSIDINELLKIIPELLRDVDTQVLLRLHLFHFTKLFKTILQVETASHLINRIIMGSDTEQDVKRILRTMAGNLTPNAAITEQVRYRSTRSKFFATLTLIISY